MDTDLKQLQIKLKKKRIKPTYIRLKILSYLENGQKHPQAERIFRAIKKEIPTVSMTSVYNTLDLFQKKGLITPLFITGSEVRFDIDVSPHQHFFCEKCGRIIDLNVDYEYLKRKNIEGHKVIEVQDYFIGVCKDCLNKIKKETRMNMYKCTVCGYVYDPNAGDPDNGIEPGTAFEDLPDDWVCPVCGADKDSFELA